MNNLATSIVSNRYGIQGGILPPLSPYNNMGPFTPYVGPQTNFVRQATTIIPPQYPPTPGMFFNSNNAITTQQSFVTPMYSSNAIFPPIQSSTTMLYASPPMPTRISIPGFSFPEMMMNPMQQNFLLQGGMADMERLPTDASFSQYSTKVLCPRCGQVSMTNVQLQLGAASYFWCVTLLPLACAGMCCLCLPDCKDEIHYCNCGEVVGYHRNSIC